MLFCFQCSAPPPYLLRKCQTDFPCNSLIDNYFFCTQRIRSRNFTFAWKDIVFFILHLHEIVEGLYFHSSLSLCVCVSVCLSVSLCVRISCEQNSSRTVEPIWMRFSLNGCSNWWPWVKGQGHSDVIPIFLHNSLLTSLPISALLCLINMKFSMSLRYTLGRIVIKFHKIRMGDDVI